MHRACGKKRRRRKKVPDGRAIYRKELWNGVFILKLARTYLYRDPMSGLRKKRERVYHLGGSRLRDVLTPPDEAGT